ncbi:proline-, glutamic acid- and leucine-rich protein 1-like [Bactrocera neohumeralis]|uniref:proline-, glutamic acid- and leucine-rich protein 1-like n=1 Tax=Bactrocera neohumeralis TaxID=98809 RepID=UPI0021658086|nr:proline-, glutamic acid- and leucine-rich protein 1-like [Bactrocera neohumeralis]
MFKPIAGLLLLVALCAAEAPTRFRTAARRPAGARVRFLARQVAAPAPAPAPTGYPAAGVTPEIPFDLPSSTVKPDVTYLPPDNTYGPPSPPQPDATYGPPLPHSTYGPPTEAPVTPDAVYGPPDNSYLPPEESVTARDVDLAVDVAEEAEEAAEEEATVEEQQPSEPEPEVSVEPAVEVEAPAEDEGEELFVAVAEDGSVIAVSNSFDAQVEAAAQQPARLVFQRFPQGRRRAPASVPVPARLIKARRVAPAKLQLLQRVQPQPKPQPQGFSFASQYTAW